MYLFVVLLLSTLYFGVFRWRRRRLYYLAKKIGGEKTIPLVGNLFNYIGDNEYIMEALKKSSYYSLNNDGASTIWFGHKLYFMVSDPVDMEYILVNCLEKDELHRFFKDLVGNGLVFAPVSTWRTRRKIILPSFNRKSVEKFSSVFTEQSRIMQQRMRNKATVDLWTLCSAYTLDSVAETVMGTKIEAQTKRDVLFLESLNDILHTACERMFRVWLQSDMLFKCFSKFTKYDSHCTFIKDFVDRVVKRRKEERNKDKMTEIKHSTEMDGHNMKTILDHLIDNSSKTKPYDDIELREEVLTVTVAGTDTTAVALTFTLLLLGKYPDVQDKVYKELLEIFGDSDRPPAKEDFDKMAYLEMMIKESMRVYPPVPFIARKIDKEITLPSGKVLPAGCKATLSIFGAHRNKKYWGEDAEVFDPDRFSPERHNHPTHPSAYMPFSNGIRNCLGYHYATLSMKTLISTVLRKYKIVVPEEELRSKIRVQIGVIMKGVKGYEVQLEERKH